MNREPDCVGCGHPAVDHRRVGPCMAHLFGVFCDCQEYDPGPAVTR